MKVRRIWRRDGGDPSEAAREVLKYSVKGTDLIECKDDIAPAIRQMEGTRLVTSWGTFFGHPANKRKRKDPCTCGKCGEAGTMVPTEVLEHTHRIRDERAQFRKAHKISAMPYHKQPPRSRD